MSPAFAFEGLNPSVQNTNPSFLYLIDTNGNVTRKGGVFVCHKGWKKRTRERQPGQPRRAVSSAGGRRETCGQRRIPVVQSEAV